MHDSFSSRSTIRVWEINACPLDFPTFDQFGRLTTVWCSQVFGTQNGDYQSTVIIYRFLYSSNMCSFRACTAPPLPCETYPAQRPSIGDNEQYFRCFFVANRSFYYYCRTLITLLRPSFSYNSTVSLLRPSFSGPNVSLTATNYPNSRIYMIIQGWRTTTSECFHHSSLKRRLSAPTRVISSSLSSSPSSPPLLLFPGSRRKLPAPSEASIADFIFADTLVGFFFAVTDEVFARRHDAYHRFPANNVFFPCG